jgi:hypothetical protein
MKISLLIVAALAGLFSGCSSMTARKAIDLTRYKHIYVEQRLSDNHRIDEQIVAELKALGCDASCGVLTMKPDGVDAIISYEDRWAWDFKSYLIEFTLYVRDARADQPVAKGYYHQAGLATKSSEAVVKKVVGELLRPS